MAIKFYHDATEYNGRYHLLVLLPFAPSIKHQIRLELRGDMAQVEITPWLSFGSAVSPDVIATMITSLQMAQEIAAGTVPAGLPKKQRDVIKGFLAIVEERRSTNV